MGTNPTVSIDAGNSGNRLWGDGMPSTPRDSNRLARHDNSDDESGIYENDLQKCRNASTAAT